MIASARLLGDVEGTNARFAVYDENRHIRRVRIIPVNDYATLRPRSDRSLI
jgi:glucokinase